MNYANAHRSYRELEKSRLRDNSRGGVLWNEAKIPPRFHFCRVQTDGFTRSSYIQRCACGAIRDPLISRRWIERNSRRRTEGGRG